MQITEVLARNAREWPNDVALVEINPQEPRQIKVVWGQGYKLEKP